MIPRTLLVFTKPARPGRVKTRLIGDLSAGQAAQLHDAFFGDLLESLQSGSFALRVAWALDPGEALPLEPAAGIRQRGADLGERLWNAVSECAADGAMVAVVGSDHPQLAPPRVHEAFAALENGDDVVIGPAADGGYYLLALRAAALRREIFSNIAWSTGQVLTETRAACERLGLRVHLLPEEHDVDTPEDLRRLAATLAGDGDRCPRTRALLLSWGRIPAEMGEARA